MNNLHRLLFAGLVVTGLAACDGGGVDLNVNTTDNSVDNSQNNSGGGDTNPCARYTDPASNVERRGTFDGSNCLYNSSFVGKTNPLRVDLTIPFISGVHVFQDSLFVGPDSNTAPAPAGGTGPKLTIEAGNRIAFTNAADYVLINRGSQILANGSPTAPIVLTGFTDAVTGTAGPEDVQLWGGLVLNGNGITNNCTDDQRANNACHVVSEGQPSYYGGNNNADSSGVLRYVVVKHAGFEVAPDDELNGITFNAVGSGTTVENVQVYSTYDDGLEFFGGAVNVRNVVMLYVRDDSLDFSDGYVGTITNALAIHSGRDSNTCIELDNIGASRSDSGQPFDTAPVTSATVRNYTCILSNMRAGTHGDSGGFRVRQGGRAIIENSIVYAGYANAKGMVGTANNRCWRPESTTGLRDAQDGLTTVDNTIFACEIVTSGSFVNGDTFADWLRGVNPSAGGRNYSFNAGNSQIANVASASLAILEPGTFYTATTLRDADGNAITVPTGQAIGGVRRTDDWTAPWAYGLRAGNRGQPLWFE